MKSIISRCFLLEVPSENFAKKDAVESQSRAHSQIVSSLLFESSDIVPVAAPTRSLPSRNLGFLSVIYELS